MKRVFCGYGNAREVTIDIPGVFCGYGNARELTIDIPGVFCGYGNAREVTSVSTRVTWIMMPSTARPSGLSTASAKLAYLVLL